MRRIVKIPFVFEILLCVFLIILFQIKYFSEYLIYSIAGVTSRSIFTDIIEITFHILVFVVCIAVGSRIQKRTLASICFFKKASAGVWGALVLCSIGFVLFHYYITFLFYSFINGWTTDFDKSEGSLLFNTINMALIPAIGEELLIKGLIFSSLKKRHSLITAIVIASLLFAVCHLQPIRIVPLFMVSCFTFWIYLRTGSIVLPMFVHFINNLFTLVLISDPFNEIGTFYAALVLLAAGVYMLYTASKKR